MGIFGWKTTAVFPSAVVLRLAAQIGPGSLTVQSFVPLAGS